jgi:hypothetical protein
MQVELLGKQGEHVSNEEVPSDAPDIVAIHARYFVRDDKQFYEGTKYVEASVFRIEKRKEERIAAGA